MGVNVLLHNGRVILLLFAAQTPQSAAVSYAITIKALSPFEMNETFHHCLIFYRANNLLDKGEISFGCSPNFSSFVFISGRLVRWQCLLKSYLQGFFTSLCQEQPNKILNDLRKQALQHISRTLIYKPGLVGADMVTFHPQRLFFSKCGTKVRQWGQGVSPHWPRITVLCS